MSESSRHSVCYQVGTHSVDINASKVISAEGQVYLLKEKALKTLLIFLEDPDRYFTNEQLIEQVYTNISIGTSSIAQNIKQLREAFGDSQKTLFATRHPVGYRLTLPVSFATELNQAKFVKTPSSNRKTFSFIGLLLIGFAVTIAVFLSWPVREKTFVRSMEQRPLTYLKGQEYFPSLSFDGHWLLFSNRHEKSQWSLQIRDMKTGKITKLFDDPDFSYKHGQLSRDGNQILLTRLSQGKCELMVSEFDSSALTVSELKLIQACDVSAQGSRIVEGSHSGQYIFSDCSALDAPFSLYKHSTITGRREQLTAPPTTGQGDYYMALSPDRSKLAFLRNTLRYTTEIRIFDLQDRSDRLLDKVDSTLFSVNWSLNGDALIYKNTPNEVVSLTVSNGQKSIIKRASFPIYAPFALDKTTTRIGVIAGSLVDSDIVSRDLVTQQQKVLLDSSFSDTLPVYAPKTDLLAWISNRNGIFQLWLKNANEDERVLTSLPINGRFTSLDFSPSGEKLGGTFEGRWFIYDLVNDDIRWSEQSKHRYDNFAWRNDSNSAHVLETYLNESVMKTLEVAETTKMVISGFPGAHLIKGSPDGRWIFIWFKDSHRFVRLNTQTEEQWQISSSNQSASTNQWVVTDNQIIWLDQPSDGPSLLWRLPHSERRSIIVNEQPYYGTLTQSNNENSIILTTSQPNNTELIEI